MEDIFISKIHINKVRHLENVDILLSETERKHLILTGRNGSGKTSVLEQIQINLRYLTEDVHILGAYSFAVDTKLTNTDKLYDTFYGGSFILGYFPAIRHNIRHILTQPNGPQKIEVKEYLSINEKVGSEFLQLLVNTRYDAIEHRLDNQKIEAEKVENWFNEISIKLGELYNDEELFLQYDRSNYNYNIVLSDGRKFDFKQLSDGYSSIIDIISEILMRMENKSQKVYDLQGIVLIDEIETHLHIDLQRKILPFLTSFFPKIQFIITTHSPFVLSSVDNAVIFDLEKQERVEDLSKYSLDAIVKGYFDSNNYSETMMQELREYENLLKSDSLTVEQKMRKNQLRASFDSLPTFLAPEIQLKLNQLKLAELELIND